VISFFVVYFAALLLLSIALGQLLDAIAGKAAD
jgi:hypothetical protein